MAAKELNRQLSEAKKAREDEVYTQLGDIERELRHYESQFTGKVVHCNCDDPRVVALESLTAAAHVLVPNPPRKAALPRAIGAWMNADGFGAMAVRPELKEDPAFQLGAAASFISTSWGFAGLAAVALKRWLKR